MDGICEGSGCSGYSGCVLLHKFKPPALTGSTSPSIVPVADTEQPPQRSAARGEKCGEAKHRECSKAEQCASKMISHRRASCVRERLATTLHTYSRSPMSLCCRTLRADERKAGRSIVHMEEWCEKL